MKNITRLLVVSGVAAVLAGCATTQPIGSLFTDVSLPVGVTGEATGSKTGEATCASYLGLIATGECSIDVAKQNGGITKVSHVDWHAHNILGLIGHYKVIVNGD